MLETEEYIKNNRTYKIRLYKEGYEEINYYGKIILSYEIIKKDKNYIEIIFYNNRNYPWVNKKNKELYENKLNIFISRVD